MHGTQEVGNQKLCSMKLILKTFASDVYIPLKVHNFDKQGRKAEFRNVCKKKSEIIFLKNMMIAEWLWMTKLNIFII